MYDFLYDFAFDKWGVENVEICGTDTDSLIMEIYTKDFYKDISPDIKENFDTSKFPKEFKCLDGSEFSVCQNKKVLGKMEDELGGVPFTKFVEVAPKNYAYLKETDKGQVMDSR